MDVTFIALASLKPLVVRLRTSGVPLSVRVWLALLRVRSEPAQRLIRMSALSYPVSSHRATHRVAAKDQSCAYGENSALLPAVQLPFGLTHPGGFTFTGLRKGVSEMVIQKSLRKELLQLVEDAAEASRQGQQALKESLLATVIARLQQGRGTALPAVQADGLITIARTL